MSNFIMVIPQNSIYMKQPLYLLILVSDRLKSKNLTNRFRFNQVAEIESKFCGAHLSVVCDVSRSKVKPGISYLPSGVLGGLSPERS